METNQTRNEHTMDEEWAGPLEGTGHGQSGHVFLLTVSASFILGGTGCNLVSFNPSAGCVGRMDFLPSDHMCPPSLVWWPSDPLMILGLHEKKQCRMCSSTVYTEKEGFPQEKLKTKEECGLWHLGPGQVGLLM